jgi:flagellar biosynthesis/type III secretory pathway M-ring protein FliF/YscJ
MLRIVLLIMVLVTAPTAAFFLWAWGVKIKQQRKIAGTLPEWQELPLTWLGIAGFAFTIVGFLVMFFTQNQGYGGLFPP